MNRLHQLGLLVLCVLAAGAYADAVSDWSEPFAVTLPEPARSIVLGPGINAPDWIARAGLDGARVLGSNRAGTILEAPMSDDDWANAQSSLCDGPGVIACETASCQVIQLVGDVAAAGRSPDAIQARLLRKPPEQVPMPSEATGDAGTCKGPPLAPPLDAVADGSTASGELSIDLTVLDHGQRAVATAESGSGASRGDGGLAEARPGDVSPADIEGTASAPAEAATGGPQPPVAGGTGAEPAAADQAGVGEADFQAAGVDQAAAEPTDSDTADASASTSSKGIATAPPIAARAFEFALESSFNPSGGVSLGTDRLPEDTSDWLLTVAAGCSEVEVPLDGIEPAKAPGLVVAVVNPGTAAAVAAALNLTIVRQVTLNSTQENLVVYATADNVGVVIAALLLDARVVSAQPEFIYRTTAEYGTVQAGTPQPYSDPFAAFTYGPRRTGALSLHPEAAGAQLVAVIDTGVADSHPELAGRVETVDVTDKGWSADSHGTAVAGIIAAAANNAVGSYGVAPAARVLALKACEPKEPGGLAARCWSSTLVHALDVAMTKDAGIINMSLAGPPDELLARYVNLALDQERLIIAGAGNNGPNAKPAFPAAIPGVIAVTAVDAADRQYPQANIGDYIDLAAPGVDIVSPAPDEGLYPPLSGTSMAAAHVSGVAALIRDLAPDLNAHEIAQLLRSRTIPLGVAEDRARFGAGLVDACAVGRAAAANPALCPDSPVGEPAGIPAGATEDPF